MKRVHINSIRATGIIGLVVIVLVFLTVPPDSIPEISTQETVVVDSAEDIINQAKSVTSVSVVDTNVKFTETDSSKITQFLDSQKIDSPLSTEKFGIQTNVALFDSEQKQYNNSTILGITQLSVTDSQGRLLDLGTVQVSLLSVSRNVEANTNVWGKINFYLDDRLVGDKYFWGSAQNTNKIDLSIVDSLSFGVSDSDKKQALPPPFSQQAKKNFTFTFSDEGLNWVHNEEHTYRVVIQEVHAILNSNQDFKEFDFVGQQIAYELKMKVDGTKKVVLGDDSKAVEVLKSDNKLHMCTQQIYVCAFCGYSSIIKSQTYTSNVPSVTIFDSNRNPIVLQAVNDSDNSCNTFTGIPRDSDVIFLINGVDYPLKTPSSQKNYMILGKLEPSGSQNYIENLAGVTFRGGYTTYTDVDYSNFGYGKVLPVQ